MRIEQKILQGLIHDNDFTTKAIPHLKPEYFSENTDQLLFTLVSGFIDKYDELPKIDSLRVELGQLAGISNDDEHEIQQTIDEIEKLSTDFNRDWLIDSTESFCKERALYLAMTKSISVMNGDEKDVGTGSIPDILSEALAITFDDRIGLDYLEDWEDRFDYYHQTFNKIPFDLEMFNKITKNGVIKKTMNLVMGPSGGGKSILFCHLAAAYMNMGHNVLYISMEMSGEEIQRRIDANLFNVDIGKVENISKEVFAKKVDTLKSKIKGKLIVEQFPTSEANVNHFKALMKDLKLKRGFVPDVVIIDYLNICSSARIKMGGSINSYTYVLKIAEEVRSLAQKEDVIMWTGTQTNREGYKSTDPGAENVAESFGLMYTTDFFIALVPTEELEELGQIMVKQIKNRYNAVDNPRRFCIGLDKAKMRFYDLEDSAQEDIIDNETGEITRGPANRPVKALRDDDKPIMDDRFGDFMF